MNSPFLPVDVPEFDEVEYDQANPAVRNAVKGGLATSSLDHFLRFGSAEDTQRLFGRETNKLAAAAERLLVSDSGFCLLLGWLADEGCTPPRIKLTGQGFSAEIPSSSVFRHARRDVEESVRGGAYDYGFVGFGQSPSRSLLKQPISFEVSTAESAFQSNIVPEIVSDKRLMDMLLQTVATFDAHAGKQAALDQFLRGEAGETLVRLFRSHVAAATANPFIERFRPRAVSNSIVTVLFGTTEPIKLQPLLFNRAGVDFGEWIYVCNSPEDAERVLRYARMISDLYDLSITIVAFGDNAGFGAANNVALQHSASDRSFLINPDVYPLQMFASDLQRVFATEQLGQTLWGGLLFYDEHNLMHSGMFVEKDIFIRRNVLNRMDAAASRRTELLRVEHFDKGVPFAEQNWRTPKIVPAVSGAVMAFEKAAFEKLGGFSTRYVYGHYEDADLSLRWNASVGSVCVHPQMRLVHLEGQGSRARGEEYAGASLVNRYFFTAQHGDLFRKDPETTDPESGGEDS